MNYLVPEVYAQIEKIEVTRPPGAIPEFSPVISGALRIVMVIAALICFLYIIWGGLEWMMSGGEKTSVATAKAKLTAAFLGLMVVLSAWAIVRLLEYLFDFNIFTFEFPKLF